MSLIPGQRAEFHCRGHCIACGSRDLVTLDAGKFSEDPVRRYIQQDPWGVDPLPFLQDQPWEFVRCEACGQMFHKWLLTPEWQEIRFASWMSEAAIREFERVRGHDAPAVKFDRARNLVKQVLRIEKLTRSIRGDGAVRLLDFGCGWGEFVSTATQWGFDACGVDRAVDRQRVSSDRGARVLPTLDAAAATAPGGFHAVTLFQVLEHVEEPLELLTAIRTRMAPGGALVLEVPNCRGITGIHLPSNYYDIHPLEHVNCFTPRSLLDMAKRAGFVPETAPFAQVTADPWGVATGEAKRWLRKFKPRSTNQCFRRDGKRS